MERARFFCVPVILALAATTSFAKLQITANVSGSGASDASLPFKDLLWQNSYWSWAELDDRSTGPGFFGGTDRYPWPVKAVPLEQIRKAAPLDENNYPTQVPFTYGGKKYRPCLVFNWFIPTRLFPMGTYTFIAEGKGVVEFGWAKDVRIELKGGKTVFEFAITEMPAINIFNNETFNAGQGEKQSGLVMTILESDPADHIRNIRLIRPDLAGGNSWANDFETCPFNPQWLNDHRIYKTLRFMDWMGVNNNIVVEWKDRITPAKFPGNDRLMEAAPYLGSDRMVSANHIPWEWQIQAVNTLNCDIWACVPARANEDYVRNLAQLFKDQLKPGLKVYLEWANETWNTMFIGGVSWGFVRDKYNSSVSNSWDAHAYMAVRNGIIFDEVLGADRVVVIVSGQSGNSGQGSNIFASLKKSGINPTGYKVDGYSCTGYFGFSGPNIGHLQGEKRTATDNGVKLYMYEGGTETGRSPALYDLYNQALETFDAEGFENFNAYVAVCGWHNWGSWGHMEYVNQPLADAHKYRALYDWAASNGQFDPNSAAPACQGTSANRYRAAAPQQSLNATGHAGRTITRYYDLRGKAMGQVAGHGSKGIFIVKDAQSAGKTILW